MRLLETPAPENPLKEIRWFSGAGGSNNLIPKYYTFLESGGLAELISEEIIYVFLHNKILVLQILLYKIVKFRCRCKVFFKEITGAPIKQKLVYYSSRSHG